MMLESYQSAMGARSPAIASGAQPRDIFQALEAAPGRWSLPSGGTPSAGGADNSSTPSTDSDPFGSDNGAAGGEL